MMKTVDIKIWLVAFFLTLSLTEGMAQADYPGVYYQAGDNTYHQYADPGPAFYKHTLHSDHFDVFYGTGYGNVAPDKLPANDPMFVDVQDLLNKAEWFFDVYVNQLKFTDYNISKLRDFRMGIFIIYTNDWLATGAGNNDKVGALWVSPMTCHPVGSTIAHEIGHSFQFQVNCDYGANSGFRYANGNGSAFWEATANWQAVIMYPNEMYSTSMGLYRNTHNLAMTHEWHRYQSYWMHFWWCDQNGMDMVGRVWRGSPYWGADPNQTIMHLKNWSVTDLYRDYFLAAMHFVTWDFNNLDWKQRGSAYDIGNFNYQFVSLGDDKFQVQYVCCPQSTGYNVIPLEVPAGGTKVTTHFTALNPGCPLADGDSRQFFNGSVFQGTGRTAYNSFAGMDNRGFRVGYVALLKDGSRRYGYEDKVYGTGTGEVTEDVTFTTPGNVDRMWLVVSPALKNYIVHDWDENMENDDQWPYQVQFVNTTILGSAKYYMYDEKTGLFFSRGGNGGTQAVADKYGLPVYFASSGNGKVMRMMDNNGAYIGGSSTISTTAAATTYIQVNANNGGCKFRNESTGKYLYIKNGVVMGDGTSTLATTWHLIGTSARNKIIAEACEAQEAKTANLSGIELGNNSLSKLMSEYYSIEDCTSKIKNATLSQNTTGWTVTGSGAGAESNVLEIYEGKGTTISQTISGLEPGIYKFTLSAFYRDGFPAQCVEYGNSGFSALSNSYIEANGNQQMICAWADQRTNDTYPNWRSEAEACFNSGKYTNEVFAHVGSDGNLEIKIVTPQYLSGGWFCFANARLYRYYREGEDVTGLIVNPGFEDSEWGKGWEGCGTGAAWDGKFVKQTSVRDHFSGNFAEMWGWFPGNVLKQTIKGLKDGLYKVEAYVIAYDQDDAKRDNIARFFAQSGGKTEDYKFRQVEPAALQSVTISVNNGELTFGIEAYYSNNDINHNVWVAVDNFRLTYLGDESIVLADSGFSTYSNAYDVTIPDGLKAYYASSCDGKVVMMSEITGGVIPANCGVVLVGDSSEEYVLSRSYTNISGIENNLLVAAVNEISVSPVSGYKTNYVLASGKFHKFTGTATIPAGKAYLQVPTSMASKEMTLYFGDADGIGNLKSDMTCFSEIIYNLQGQRVGNDFKGIVIRNGRKYLQK